MDRLSLISLLVGGVLPLLVATVTKESWPEPLKALLLAALSAATGVGTALVHPGSANAHDIATNAAVAFVSGAAVAAGTWKPTGAYARLERVFIHDVMPVISEAEAARRTGIGTVQNPSAHSAPSYTLMTPVPAPAAPPVPPDTPRV